MLLSAPAPATAADRMPTGKWIVEYGDSSCMMSRQFGSKAEPLIVAIKKMPMHNDPTLLIIFSAKSRAAKMGKGRLGFADGVEPEEVTFWSYSSADAPVRRLSINLTEDQLNRAEKAAQIRVAIPYELQEDFRLPGIAEAMKVADTCAVGLGEKWGFPAQEQGRLKKAPTGTVAKFVSHDDYPADALRNDEQGTAEARLIADRTGRPTDCTIIVSSGSKSLDEATCRAGVAARFAPAIDVEGKPTRGLVVYSLTWAIP
jgi:TonB family protein